MVRAKELAPAVLIEAMERGDFYASTGVTLKDVSFNKNKLKVEVDPEAGTSYTIQFWGADKSDVKGKLLKEVKGTGAGYKLKRKLLYARAKIISSKLQENPFREGDLESAWVQPVTR